MAEHEPSIGATSDWYTPPSVFKALGLVFDLDPCSPGPHYWVPAKKVYTIEDDGLRQRWHGLVFCNPPFGGRNGHVPWLIAEIDRIAQQFARWAENPTNASPPTVPPERDEWGFFIPRNCCRRKPRLASSQEVGLLLLGQGR